LALAQGIADGALEASGEVGVGGHRRR
jgi:hypothetical protein